MRPLVWVIFLLLSSTPAWATITSRDISDSRSGSPASQGAGPRMEVTAYGATGNGVTDDTAAIQAATNAAESAKGSTVFFVPGNYVITSPITYAGGGGAGWGLRFEGADWDSTNISDGSASGLPYFFTTAVPATQQNVSFENIHLVGGAKSHGGLNLNVDFAVVKNLWFSNINGYSIVTGPTGGNIVSIVNCRFEDNFEPNSAGIDVLADWVHLFDNAFSKLAQDAVTVGSSSVKPYNIVAVNTHCFWCRSYVFDLVQVLEFSALNTSDELDPDHAKTHEFGMNIADTVVDPQTVSVYDWHAQTVAGVHASYRTVQDNGRNGALGILFSSGQSPRFRLSYPLAVEGLHQYAAHTWADVSACSSGKKTIDFTRAFNSVPVILVFDETKAGGAKLASKSAKGFVVSCSGATDTFDWVAIGNPN